MFASLALMILMGCAATMPPPSVVEDPAAGRQGQSVEAYLRMKEQELSDTAATLHALGRGGEVEGLREQVTRSDAIGNADLVGDGPEQRAAVRDALELTAAQYMASVGIILESAETAGAAGFDVAASAARLVTGTSGFHDFVALAEQAFVGTVQSVRGDVSGRLISVRGTGGRAITYASASATTLEPGDECVVFLSTSLAQFRAASPRHATTEGELPVEQFPPFCRSNGAFRSTSPYHQQSLIAEEVHRNLAIKPGPLPPRRDR